MPNRYISIHKKADIIAALKMERGNIICSKAFCTKCSLAEKGVDLCLPLSLKKPNRLKLIAQIEAIKIAAPFRTVETAKVLIKSLTNKLI